MRVRYPDGSYIRNHRLPNPWPDGPALMVPDLIFKRVTRQDLYEGLAERSLDFLRAGTPLIWVFCPTSRSVRVLRANGSRRELLETETLTGEAILPGLSVKMSELLPPASELLLPSPGASAAAAPGTD